MNQRNILCPLCEFTDTKEFYGEAHRKYWKCFHCSLIFVPRPYHLGPHAEKDRYQQHQNQPDDPDYRRFLNRLVNPLVAKLKATDRGLDFGAGPGPTLSVMMGERGFSVKDYDPYFFPREDLLQGTYSFITCSETAEHFFNPKQEFMLMDRMLQPGGWLGVMTEWVTEESRFPDWYYRRDPTHVSFYRRETLAWIARWRSWEVEFPEKNISLFFKKRSAGHESTLVK